MGYIRHDAIVVTTITKECSAEAIEKATELGLPTTSAALSTVNGKYSFLIAPDGSKSGWDEDAKGKDARDKWKSWATENWLRLFLSWVHIEYGGDNRDHCSIEDFSAKHEPEEE